MAVLSHFINAAQTYDDVYAECPTVFVLDPDPVTGTMVTDLLEGYTMTIERYASGRSSLPRFLKLNLARTGPVAWSWSNGSSISADFRSSVAWPSRIGGCRWSM